MSPEWADHRPPKDNRPETKLLLQHSEPFQGGSGLSSRPSLLPFHTSGALFQKTDLLSTQSPLLTLLPWPGAL